MGYIIGPNVTRIDTSATLMQGVGFGLGDRYTDHLGNTWVYILASLSIAQYDCLAVKANYHALPMTDAASKLPIEVAFAQVAFADKGDSYGWAMTSGRGSVRVAIDCEPSVPLYITATAGVLDDATLSSMIQGVVITTSATAAGGFAMVATFPRVNWGANLNQI